MMRKSRKLQDSISTYKKICEKKIFSIVTEGKIVDMESKTCERETLGKREGENIGMKKMIIIWR